MKISDNYIDLNGFLEGDKVYPLQWRQISFSEELADSEWTSVEYFKTRVREFLSNIDDLGLKSSRHLSVNRAGPKVIVKSDVYPNRHRAKSVYLDFRHFIANKEPSKFERVANIIKRYTSRDDLIHVFMDNLKKDFVKQEEYGIKINGKSLTVSSLIDIWFNTEFFHAGEDSKIAERELWLEVLEHDSAHKLLFWAILNSAHPIKCLYACVKDLNRNRVKIVNCPDEWIINR